MNKDEGIIINSVKNGFVTRKYCENHVGGGLFDDVMIFQSFVEMIHFLEEHFSFRSGILFTDMQKGKEIPIVEKEIDTSFTGGTYCSSTDFINEIKTIIKKGLDTNAHIEFIAKDINNFVNSIIKEGKNELKIHAGVLNNFRHKLIDDIKKILINGLHISYKDSLSMKIMEDVSNTLVDYIGSIK